MSFQFSGQVAVVTGSSRNLGSTIAEVLAVHGATVVVHYSSSAQRAHHLVDTITSAGGVAEAFGADLTDIEDVSRFSAGVLDRYGHVDILVNNVGPYTDIPFTMMPVEDWDRVMNSGLRACYLLARAFAPGMRARGQGHIVNISAGSAFIRVHSVYGLAKAALLHLTECLALELAPDIRVNAIAPGQIAESEEVLEIDPTYIQRMTEGTPLRRLVSRREVADAVCMMCSDFLPSLTGQTLVLDGGWSIPVGRETPILNASV